MRETEEIIKGRTSKKCPLCGGDGIVKVLRDDDVYLWFVECPECDLSTILYPTMERAVKGWEEGVFGGEDVPRPRTAEDINVLAIGVYTGYRDRNGTPIRVGDEVIYFKKCVKHVGWDHVEEYPREYVVGTGGQGYVYSGKIVRRRYTVEFDFERGLNIIEPGCWKYLTEKDEKGNLLTILVDNKKTNPKLTLDDVLGKK